MFDSRETEILSIMIIACGLFLMGLSLYFFRRIKTYDDYNVAGRSTATFPLICTLVGTAVGGSTLLAGKMHEKPLYDGPRSALPKGPHVVI